MTNRIKTAKTEHQIYIQQKYNPYTIISNHRNYCYIMLMNVNCLLFLSQEPYKLRTVL